MVAKIWCGTIKIISRNKDKTFRLVPQCGTNWGKYSTRNLQEANEGQQRVSKLQQKFCWDCNDVFICIWHQHAQKNCYTKLWALMFIGKWSQQSTIYKERWSHSSSTDKCFILFYSGFTVYQHWRSYSNMCCSLT